MPSSVEGRVAIATLVITLIVTVASFIYTTSDLAVKAKVAYNYAQENSSMPAVLLEHEKKLNGIRSLQQELNMLNTNLAVVSTQLKRLTRDIEDCRKQ